MKRSKFSLSHSKLLTMDMGQLIPIGLVEVLPGDSFQQATSALVRASPLLAPVMHPVDVRIHHWYVPHRLVWTDWENFITGGPDGLNASVPPTIALTTPAISSLPDYLGVPTGSNITVGALPFRGYAAIWNEWYRDQDLQTKLTIDLTDGADTTTNIALQNCGWEKDYFTSARPWEQKGPAITLPLGTRAPVSGIGHATSATYGDAGSTYKDASTTAAGAVYPHAVASNTAIIQVRGTAAGAAGVPDVYADLSQATSASVNLLREAFALQRFEEARARYGSRYTEYLRYLGVRSSDARLQRPEYLGGGRDTIQFSEVLQTGVTTSGNAAGVGTLRGHGIAALRSNRYRRFFEEHGYIHSFMSVRPKTMYIQGLPRHWSRTVKEDYWQVELQHIGQQEVLNKEVYAPHATPNGVFGYQDRYDEYRRNESWVSGEFRTTLDEWHFARAFGSDPALNASFVKCVPSEEPFASPSTNTLWVQVKHSIQARRLVAATGSSYIY